jgi:aspartyl-tRNA(Asn)/glutamyl-tRNA(Gln) amidotransferase subunit C
MIDRDQVLHVAKLARLKVTDDEVDRMAEELSKILEHVETMNELDLEGVKPTSHVVDLTNVLREDVPRPGLAREKALEQAPDAADGGFRVPSPGAS